MRAVVVAAMLAGCYSPTPQPGAPCANGQCPSGLVCSPATNTCEREAVATDAPLPGVDAPMADAGIDAPASPFAYRRALTIANASTSTLPIGFTIRVPLADLATLVSAGKVEADFSDLRVIGDGNLGERDRIVDPPAGPAPPAVSFALAAAIAPGATSTSYALYYGRPNAGVAPANGAAVFPIYDDFNGNLASFWLTNDAPAISAGRLVLRANRTDAIATTASTDDLPIVSAIELVASVADPNSDSTPQPTGTFWYWFGYQRTGDFTATDPWVVWIARAKGEIKAEQKSPVGCETNCAGPVATQNTAAHHYAIERDANATRFYLDGALRHTITVTNSTDYSIMIRNFMATSDLAVDWVRARARVSPDPTVAVGTEQAL
jgi:hypothetical protein